MERLATDCLSKVRDARPLVHHITNYVTVNDCANVCICTGGSPVMSDAAEDVPGMVGLASAVVLNIGTLNPRTVESMLVAGKVANSKGIPVVLDPVGAGATEYRTACVRTILDRVKISVIKGNAGEICVMAGMAGTVRGVDSGDAGDVAGAVKALASRHGCVVAASGPVDYVSDGKTVMELENGSPMMENVSGTGCMLSSVIGCFVGACGASAGSVASAITTFNVASEDAEKMCKGPGSFKTALMDCLFNIDPSTVGERARWNLCSNYTQ